MEYRLQSMYNHMVGRAALVVPSISYSLEILYQQRLTFLSRNLYIPSLICMSLAEKNLRKSSQTNDEKKILDTMISHYIHYIETIC